MSFHIPAQGSNSILISWEIFWPVITSKLIFNQADLKALRNKNLLKEEWEKHGWSLPRLKWKKELQE